MTDLNIGDKAPNFNAETNKGPMSFAELKGKPVVLYFYPRDDTPGCTAEACDFRDSMARLNKTKAAVIGVSKDSIKSHEKFAKKFDLTFPLAADEDQEICKAYGVWVEKSMYGKKYMGIDRATFVIDAQGKIAASWRKVKVPGHIAEVLKTVEAL